MLNTATTVSIRRQANKASFSRSAVIPLSQTPNYLLNSVKQKTYKNNRVFNFMKLSDNYDFKDLIEQCHYAWIPFC